MDLVLISTQQVKGKNGKMEEVTYTYAGVSKKIATAEYKGDDPRIEYYNSKGEVGFTERTEADKKIAEAAGFHYHWNEETNQGALDFQEELPKKVDAFQKQQALIKQKITGRE